MSDFPGGGADVPSLSNHLGKDNQVWERPWTLGEMRQASANWSLAADSGLFLFLQDFSQRMLSKTHDIEKQLDGLMRDTKATDSCLHSVFNDFLMLSNTQFIENRVYDEEVEEPIAKVESAVKHPEKEKTREQKEAELIPKMQEAVNYGLRVLDSAFEQLDIKAGNSDSEDEEAMDRVEAILEPKDLYVDRPLPYLIGSQAFMEQDDVGLGDLSSDEMSIDSDRDSVIESEDGKGEVQSDEEFEEAEGRGSINKSSVLSYEEDEEEDEDSDIFGESDKEEEYEDENERKIASSTSFVDELAARIKGDPVSKGEEERASLASSKKRAKSKKVAKAEKSPAAAVVRQESDDMFQPPRMEEEEFSPFGGGGGLFSGGRGLFDDDDEGDLFGDTPKRTASEDKAKSAAHMAESVKSEKKTPAGAVSVFPADNGLFGSGHSTAPVEGKENVTHGKPKAHPSPKQPPVRASGIGGGLFDDEEEEDFFSGRSVKTSSSAERGKSKTKKVADLFLGDGDDDEEDEGDIFSEKSAVQPPVLNKKEVVEEGAKPPEKKMPAGAISIFGPGTKSLMTESLRRRRASTSEGSEKSEENGPPVETPVSHTTPGNQTQIPQARGLFSDDEDTQVFPTPSKNQSKPGSAQQPKAPVSLFDDEEEEDLFASVAKSKPKPSQAKATTPQPQKTLSLFSDDEDQWLGSQPGTGRTETKTGVMKASVSAPSNLPSARAPPNGSLFDDEDEDLFATAKTSSPLKSQRVALLFEDDEDQGFLFGSKPAIGSSAKASATKAPVVAPKAPAPSLFDQEPRKEVPASGSVVEKAKPPEDTCDGEVPDRQPPSSSSSSSSTSSTISSSLPASDREPRKQKPAGAVSLFGGIDIMASRRREGAEGDVLTEDRLPPPDVGEEEEEEEEETTEKTKANPVSIFDGDDNDDDDEEEDSDWNVSGAVVRPPITTNTKQPAREQQRTKSTGVFQDEELLFSDRQQKDNDPDVDLFATSGKTVSAKPSSVKTDVPSLFADDEDDLFSSAKPKPPHPKIAKKPSKPKQEPTPSWKGISAASTPDSERTAASPVKAKDPLSRIGKLQANLVINPKAMLPGAAPRIPGAGGALPGTPPGSSSGVSSSSLSPSPVTTPLGSTHSGMEQGVSFESPLQVAPLPSTNKSRVKGSGQRRPQSRAARQQSVQRSVSDQEDSAVEPNPRLNPTTSALGFPTTGPKPNLRAPRPMLPKPSGTSAFPTPSPSQLSFTESLTRPSVLSLPVSTHPGETDSSEVSGDAQPMLSSSDEDLFGSVAVSKSSAPPAPSITKKAPDPSPAGGPAPVSIFDQQATSDLFQKVKPRAKKAQAPSFMEDADEDGDDDEDIFGMSTGSTPSSTSDSRTPSSPAKLDRFQDNETTLPKAGHKKHKEKTMEASLFDDNVDIFADLTMSSGAKDKPKKKMDTKSIFDDDMDDIFSSNKVKPVKKAPPKSKKSKPTQDNSVPAESANIFDDPLNAFGGN
ncbi:WASH complex subunit 2 isoform X2 [Gadus morhua]|uniref:WASH complex subunit 2 isoform X2 n=1 Tax=Gadus morhua TaxID=8049 RepID=UPI0011B50B85|nr:WASH complex subunit 2-like isoform X2 [Gadus morhua]